MRFPVAANQTLGDLKGDLIPEWLASLQSVWFLCSSLCFASVFVWTLPSDFAPNFTQPVGYDIGSFNPLSVELCLRYGKFVESLI